VIKPLQHILSEKERFKQPGDFSLLETPFLVVEEGSLSRAQKALTQRPTMSIRVKIIMGFFVLFILCAGASITFYILGVQINQKLKFMEAGSSFAFEIQQARRFEKNFFLYRTKTNLVDALENVQNARELLKIQEKDISAVIGKEKWQTMMGHIDRYEKLLDKLRNAKDVEGTTQESYGEIEGELRQHGAEMLAFAVNLVQQERKEVENLSKLSRQIPLVFLAVLLILMIYLTLFLAQQIVRPLNRFVEYTRRIARGDFSPIQPAKRYKDEFSRLAISINWMLDQLEKNQELYIQSKKLASLGILIAGVAHEVGNPLNNISMTAQAYMELYDHLSKEDKIGYMEKVLQETERIRGIVQDLLDFSKPKKADFREAEVNNVVRKTLKLVHNMLHVSAIETNLELQEGLPHVFIDENKIQEVLINLITNAIQAMSPGGELSIATYLGEDKEYVVIEVGDTGKGIPSELLPNIFDPFFSSKGIEGTGLGLSVSYSIIKNHKGNLKVKSEVGVGTTFFIELGVHNGKEKRDEGKKNYGDR
jgi:two-component system NtrC family sensor kinase